MSETNQTAKVERKKQLCMLGGRGGKGCALHDQAQQFSFAFKFFFKQVVGHNGAEYKSLLLPVRLVYSKQNVGERTFGSLYTERTVADSIALVDSNSNYREGGQLVAFKWSVMLPKVEGWYIQRNTFV